MNWNYNKSTEQDAKNEAEFIRIRNEKQNRRKSKPAEKNNVIRVDFVNKKRLD
jgi:hypothetical protein